MIRHVERLPLEKHLALPYQVRLRTHASPDHGAIQPQTPASVFHIAVEPIPLRTPRDTTVERVMQLQVLAPTLNLLVPRIAIPRNQHVCPLWTGAHSPPQRIAPRPALFASRQMRGNYMQILLTSFSASTAVATD